MIKQENVVEVPLRTAAVTLITVSEMTVNYGTVKGQLNVAGYKRPLAFAVATRHGTRVFEANGTEMGADEFVTRFPDTKPLMEGL